MAKQRAPEPLLPAVQNEPKQAPTRLRAGMQATKLTTVAELETQNGYACHLAFLLPGIRRTEQCFCNTTDSQTFGQNGPGGSSAFHAQRRAQRHNYDSSIEQVINLIFCHLT